MHSAKSMAVAAAGAVLALAGLGGGEAQAADLGGEVDAFPAVIMFLLFGLGMIAMAFACFWRSPASMVMRRIARLSAENRRTRPRPR